MAIDVGGMRTAYKSALEAFTEDQLLSKEPISQFESWFNEAKDNPQIIEANAMCLATATKDGTPSCRIVLLKRFGKEGFVFFTNYNSRKGRELATNPKASLCFYWESLKRSVQIEGVVEKISEQESKDYFQSRPKSSQIGACVSPQSEVIASRAVLTDKQKELENLYQDDDAVIPKPDHWGGFIVVPHRIEFWQGQTNRVHDRILFTKKSTERTTSRAEEDEWLIQRLAP